MLSKDELIQGYTRILGSPEKANIEIDTILRKIGLKASEPININYHEFLKANLTIEHEVTDQKLKAAFNLFDIDGNGTITLEEIQYLLGG